MSVPPFHITVNSTAEGSDATPGDGICETVTGSGTCTLRAAIDEANATTGKQPWVHVPNGSYDLRAGTDETNVNGDLDVAPTSGSVIIEGLGDNVSITSLSADGGFDVRSGTVTIRRVRVSLAFAGVRVRAGAIGKVSGVSLLSNLDGAHVVASGRLEIDNSTITGNLGTGIRSDGTTVARFLTITDNTEGALRGAGPVTVAGSILRGPTVQVCGSAVTSQGWNVATDASCGLSGTGDLASAPVDLAPLSHTPVPHLDPRPGTPMIDAIPPGTGPCPTGTGDPDQIGTLRPVGGGCDRGAIDTNAIFTVDTATDAVDATADGVCDIGDGTCSLRAAVSEANARPGADTVTVADGVEPTLAIAGRAENGNATGDLDVTGDLLMDGAGGTIDGGGVDRIFETFSVVIVRDVVLQHGDARTAPTTGSGGALRSAGDTTLERVRLTGNVAADGGGASGVLTVRSSTIDGNEATVSGGGLQLTSGSSSVVNSTISGNAAPTTAAVVAPSGSGTLPIRASTITNNVGPTAVGGTALRFGGSIVAAPGGQACATTIASSGRNVVDDTSCGFAGTGDQTVISAELGPLADNGGPTPTHAPAATSAAIDAIAVGVIDLCPTAGTAVDQRGVARPVGGACDVGAVEGAGSLVVPVTLTVDTAADLRDPVPGDGVCGTGPGDCALRAAIDEANRTGLVTEIRFAPGIEPVISRAGAGEDLNVTGDLDLWGRVTIIGPTSIDGAGLDRVLHNPRNEGHLRIEDVTIEGGLVVAAGGQGAGLLTTAAAELDAVTIAGNQLTGSGTTAGAGVYALGPIAIDGSTFTDNSGAVAGGGLASGAAATVTITDSTFTGNSATSGGALAAGGTATLTDATASGNSGGALVGADTARLTVVSSDVSGNGGRGISGRALVISDSTVELNTGGGIHVTGSVSGLPTTIDRVTVSGNTATDGAGIRFDGAATLSRSTVTANVASGRGGGIRVAATGVEITASTITANQAATEASEVDAVSGAPFLQASTVAGEQALAAIAGGFQSAGSILSAAVGPACAAGSSWASQGWNVATDATCASGAPSDIVAGGPLLGPLGDHGGPTETRVPLPGSVPIEAIPVGTPGLCGGSILTDQRGSPRPGGNGCDAGAVEDQTTFASPLLLTVNSAADAVDAAIGDGVCATAAATCTLRAAISEANAGILADEITIAPGINPQITITGADEDANVTGDLDVRDTLQIHGGGATLDARFVDRAIDHHAGQLAIDGLTLTRGQVTNAGGGGGGIRSISGLTVRTATFRNNRTTGAGSSGGAVQVSSPTGLVIERSTLVDNRATGTGSTGGGVAVLGAGRARIENSTLSANVSTAAGAAVSGGADLVLSTIDNSGSVALAGAVSLHGVAITGSGNACSEPITSLGYNLTADMSCSLAGTGDVQSADALLHNLAANGGPTETRIPASNSALVDAIPGGTVGLCDGAVPTDQRGVARPGGGACDIGAVDGSGAAKPPLALTVDTAADELDLVANDGLCLTATGHCSLRAAITEANQHPFQLDTITIGAGTDPVLTRTGATEDANVRGDLDVAGNLVIEGGGATVDAAGIDRVIHHLAGTLTVRQLEVRGGAGAGLGGGIRVQSGSVTFEDSTIAGNTATGSDSFGGGLWSNVGASVVLDRTTVTDNQVSITQGIGGGLFVRGPLLVRNSTISDNRAAAGSGIARLASGTTGTVVIRSSTVVGGTGGSAITGPIQLHGSLVAAGTSTSACNSVATSLGWNVFSDASCPATGPGDVVAAPLLGALANNGGPTLTHLPGVSSVAIDAIPVGTPGLCDGTIATDQRGSVRPAGPACDVGAVER